MTTLTPATPAKLRSGEWGARVHGPAKPGDEIEVRTKSGKSWTAVVDRVVWTDGQVSLCATMSLARYLYGPSGRPSDGRSNSRASTMCAECGERRGVIECQDSSGLVGLCCRRCASLSRYERSFA
jgi:hypothetical protein